MRRTKSFTKAAAISDPALTGSVSVSQRSSPRVSQLIANDNDSLSPPALSRKSASSPVLPVLSGHIGTSEIRSPRSPTSEERCRSPTLESPRPTLNIKRLKLIHFNHLSNTKIWKAKIDGWTCCVKEILFDQSDTSKKTIEMFRREVEILRTLPSAPDSHLPQYLGYQFQPDSIQMIMSLYDGSLFDIIVRRKATRDHFSIREIAEYTQQILLGLVVLHSRRILHSDLKSMNIFYEDKVEESEFVNLVIGDLGETKIVNTRGFTFACGTPMWMAPEVFNGDTPYSFPADVYSLGMIMYEMMELEVPYHDFATKWMAIDNICNGVKPTLTQQEHYLQLLDLYSDLIATNPEKRPLAADALFKIKNIIAKL